MMRFRSVPALIAAVAASSCSNLTDCGSCIALKNIVHYKCHWCDVDQACHKIGSANSPCSSGIENDRCASQSRLSKCETKTCRAASEAIKPSQMHFALADSTGLRVMWKTDALPSACSLVVSSAGSSKALTFAAERPLQYLEGHGYHHVAAATHLTPGTAYKFHAECDGVSSDALSFHVPAKDSQDARFLVVGDMGWSEFAGAEPSRKRMEALVDSVDLTLHVGDIGYADDSFLHSACHSYFCYEAVYDKYMMWMERVFSSKPYMVTPGNHETECHSPNCLTNRHHMESLRNFTAYNARWRMPSQESGGAASMWYSFDYGPIHFVSLNTETDFPNAPEGERGGAGAISGKSGHFAPDGEYLRWLEADLRAASQRRAERPWIVAMGHRTWVYRDSEPTDSMVGDAHKPLFDKYGVDLYLAGHQHAYSRHLPVAGGTAIVVTGAAGCDEGLDGWPATNGSNVNGYNYISNGVTHQVGTIDATAESLTWQAHISQTGEILDSFTLTKDSVDMV